MHATLMGELAHTRQQDLLRDAAARRLAWQAMRRPREGGDLVVVRTHAWLREHLHQVRVALLPLSHGRTQPAPCC